MTDLKNLGGRATAEFIEALDQHIKRLGFNGSRSDYILTALVEKMISESDEDVPSPKAPHGVRMDARPEGWKSRLYADRYELVVDENMKVHHLHEYGSIEKFRCYRKKWGDGIGEGGEWRQANCYVHHALWELSQGTIHFEDSPVGEKVRKFIESQE
jgi:hypothetical protein